MNSLPTLYKYGIYSPLMWQVSYGEYDGDIVVKYEYGALYGNHTHHVSVVEGKNIGKANETTPLQQAKLEATAEWKNKLQQGYKEDLSKISPLITDANEILKPMKAQPFSEENIRKHIKFPLIQQPKLNGLRATLRWEHNYTEGEGMFKTTTSRAVIRSKEGIEYHMPHITNTLTESFFLSENGDQLAYDGELYKHGMKLNQIKASCPFKKDGKVYNASGNPLEIKFYTFDLSVPKMGQWERLYTISGMLHNCNENIVYLYPYKVFSLEEATKYHKIFLADGYEGSILRNMEADYTFGKRPVTMMKWKQKRSTECKINDIIIKNEDISRGRSYITFVLQNDINDHTFEAVPLGDENQRVEYLANKEKYIGRMATVEFYERSGVKAVPFQGNVIVVRDEIDYDKNDLIPE